MQRKLIFALVVLVGILAAGCSKGSKVVGTWDTTLPGAAAGPAVIEFKSDGKMALKADIPKVPGMKMAVTGTWREEGDKLHVTILDAKFENLPAQAKAMEAQINERAKKEMEVGKEQADTMKFDGDDSFTLTSGKGTVSTFKRKK